MNSETPSTELIYRAVGSRIREERVKRNITQEDLAASVGLTRASVTNIERGRQRMPVHVLVALATSLHVSPAHLVGSFEPKTSAEIEALVPEAFSDAIKQWIMAGA